MSPGRPRVLWVHQNFVAGSQAGHQRPVHTVAAMLEAGFAVDLVTGTEGYLGSRLGPGAQRTVSEGALTWHRVPLGEGSDYVGQRAWSYVAFAARVARLLRTLPAPDLVFASSPPLPQIALAIEESARHRVPLVLEVRDLWPAFLVEAGLLDPGPLVAGLEALELLACQGAAAVVTVSPAFTPYLEALGVPRGRIVTAPHGAAAREVPRLREHGLAWRRERGLERAFVALYAGSLNAHYGVEALLEAARLAEAGGHGIHWVVAGHGRARGEVERASRALETVHFEGPLPRNRLDALLGAADVGLVTLADLPLFCSVLPGKLVDCLSAGLPVVCMVQGQAARLVEVAGAGWTGGDRPGSLLEAVCAARDAGPPERRAAGERGAAWVRARMSAEAQGRRIAALCLEVVTAGERPRRRELAGRCAKAARGVASGLAPRALDRLYRERGGAEAVRAFDAWAEACPVEAAAPPLEVPRLLL